MTQLCAWKRLRTSLLGEMQGTRTKHMRGDVWGPEGRNQAAAALGPATAKLGLANGKRKEGVHVNSMEGKNKCHDLLTT